MNCNSMQIKVLLYAWYCVEISNLSFQSLVSFPVVSHWMRTSSRIFEFLSIAGLNWMAATRICGLSVVLSFACFASPWGVIFVAVQGAGCTSLFAVGRTLLGATIGEIGCDDEKRTRESSRTLEVLWYTPPPCACASHSRKYWLQGYGTSAMVKHQFSREKQKSFDELPQIFWARRCQYRRLWLSLGCTVHLVV